MKIIINHIPLSKKRPGTSMVAQYLTIHSTGNPKSTARNERAWLVNPSNERTASWHIVIDEKEAIEAIPLNEKAYHAGNFKGNKTSIGIEICESGDRIKTLKNAVERVADLLKKRNWGVNKLRKHHDWSGKICPRILSANNWAGWKKFKEDVKQKIREVDMKECVYTDNDVDARIGAYLAENKNMPLIVNSLPTFTADKVYAIGLNAVTKCRGKFPSVIELSGKDRFKTAKKVMGEI